MSLLVRLAWRNLWRQKRRSLITAFAMAVAVALSMASMALQNGVYTMLFEVMVEQQLGHAQVQNPTYRKSHRLYDTVPEAASTIAALRSSSDVRVAAGKLYGFGLIGGAEKTVGGQMMGIQPRAERALNRADERIVEGRYLAETAHHEIVLGVGLAEEIEVGVGGSVVVMTQAADGSLGNDVYQVVGLFKTGAAMLDRSGTMLHLQDLQELLALPDQVHGIYVLGTDGEDLQALKAHLIGIAPPSSEVTTWREASPTTAQLIDMQTFANGLVLGIVFAVASFGVLNTMMMSVFERTRELGVLKAIGLRPSQMVMMVMVESFFLAVVAGAMGLFIGGLLDLYLVQVGIDFSSANPQGFEFNGIQIEPMIKGVVDYGGVATVVAALVVVSVLASLYPAFRASRLVPVEALRANG